MKKLQMDSNWLGGTNKQQETSNNKSKLDVIQWMNEKIKCKILKPPISFQWNLFHAKNDYQNDFEKMSSAAAYREWV